MMYRDCGCYHAYHSCYHYPRYGFGSFIFDLFMLMITGGLWVFWILYRFIRRPHC
jgi:hypothetical protein